MDERIRAVEIAFVLDVIDNPPNLRDTRGEGDLDGDFDRWFDGGAIERATGVTRYHFFGGIVASVLVSPSLVVHVTYPDGRVVSILQEGPSLERPRLGSHSKQYARPARWHCGTCGTLHERDGSACFSCKSVRPYAAAGTTMRQCAGCTEWTLASARFCEWCGARAVDA